jgi:flagellar L-ring protein precursor FlgH
MMRCILPLVVGGLLAGISGAAVSESLYRPDTFRPLISDTRQRQVGDLLTVMVYESASASSSADTSANRDASVSVNLERGNRAVGGSLRSTNQLEGGGRTQRENRVLAQLTVTVKQVLPNGQLLIAGEQTLDVNGEKQTIALDGLVRPQDVSETNIVLSSHIANARIRFLGEGELSSRHHSGWWQKFLTMFGL